MRRRSRSLKCHGHYYYHANHATIDAAAQRANWVWRRGGTRGMVTAEFTTEETTKR